MKLSYYLKRNFCLFVLVFLPFALLAQNQLFQYGAKTSVYSAVDGEALPFWLYANTDGRVDGKSSNFITSLYSYYHAEAENSDFRFGSGLNISSRFAETDNLFFNELYGTVGYKFLNLKFGRFYDPIGGFPNSNLTMGSMEISRNAMAVPKVELLTDGYLDVPWTQGYLQFKAMLSHGWLEDHRYIKHAYFHQKYLYLKVNYKRFDFIAGLIHNVIWAGTDPKRGKLPSSFGDYLRIFTGSAASQNSNATGSDKINALGNMAAGYDFKMNVNFDHFQIKAYRLFYLEDRVAAQFRSPWDGMYGLTIKLKETNSIVNEILWEHINTKRQDAFDYEPRGISDYYNHSGYKSGWSYQNNVLGNPLIIFGPNPNFLSSRAISNNIIIGHHIGVKGRIQQRFSYKALFTYSRNYGTKSDQTNPDPDVSIKSLRVDEYSFLLRGNYNLMPASGLSVFGAAALDLGKLYGQRRLGFQIGLRFDRLMQ